MPRRYPYLHLLTCIFNELMHEWRHVCVCTCMSVLCLRGRCMFCVTFPALAFSYLFYYTGDRKSQILHTRLRTNCIGLNISLYQKNIVDSPMCNCGAVESTDHYMLLYWSLLNWHNLRLRCGCVALPVNWFFDIISSCFVKFKNVVHSFEPG